METMEIIRMVIGISVMLAVRGVSRRAGPAHAALILGLPLSTPLYLLLNAPTATASRASLCSAIAASVLISIWSAVTSQTRNQILACVVSAFGFVASGGVLAFTNAGMAVGYFWIAAVFVICGLVCSRHAFHQFQPADVVTKRAVAGNELVGYLLPVLSFAALMVLRKYSLFADFLGGFPIITVVTLLGEWFGRNRNGAVRIAISFPAAQLSTIVFLALFTVSVESLGPNSAAIVAFVSAASVAYGVYCSRMKTPEATSVTQKMEAILPTRMEIKSKVHWRSRSSLAPEEGKSGTQAVA